MVNCIYLIVPINNSISVNVRGFEITFFRRSHICKIDPLMDLTYFSILLLPIKPEIFVLHTYSVHAIYLQTTYKRYDAN